VDWFTVRDEPRTVTVVAGLAPNRILKAKADEKIFGAWF
jgi:hypothetical protein